MMFPEFSFCLPPSISTLRQSQANAACVMLMPLTNLGANMTQPIDDEWWTTAMVCRFLKIGRRALWDIRRDPTKGFAQAIKPGGKLNLFRASEVRSWMDQREAGRLKPPAPTAQVCNAPQTAAGPASKTPNPESTGEATQIAAESAKRAQTRDVGQLAIL